MQDFLRLFCLAGLPAFALAGCSIWRPGTDSELTRSDAARITWTFFALLVCFVLVLPLGLFPLAVCRIWTRGSGPKSTADRVAWTAFALGVSLMLTMALFGMTQDLRSWDTIRLHTRVFLGLSLIPVAGPLVVYLVQVRTKRSPTPPDKKQPIDDWDKTAWL